MKITVAVAPSLLPYIPKYVMPNSGGEWSVDEGATVTEIVAMLHFSEGAEVLVIVNDVCCLDQSRQLKEGDSVLLAPLVAGG
jgi:sulfur carrier protein ThiS